MINRKYCIDELTPELLNDFRIWKGITSFVDGRICLKPTGQKKIKNTKGMLLSSVLLFADGSKYFGLIEGIDVNYPKFSIHNRVLHIYIPNHGMFELARYNDPDYWVAKRGGAVLCDLCGKSVSDVFPIFFDLSDVVSVQSECLSGHFEINPTWGISSSEVMDILLEEVDAHEK